MWNRWVAVRWIENWLIGGVVISSAESGWRPVTSGTPRGWCWVWSCSTGIECMLSKFADDTKLGVARLLQTGELDRKEPGEV